jgi:uridylate kinase
MMTQLDSQAAPLPTAKFKRILLKLSGEALGEKNGSGIDLDKASDIARRVKNVQQMGVQIGIVIGGGNLWRGKKGVERGMNQSYADNMGMIATVINALLLRDALEREGIITRVQTAIEMNKIAEPYIRLRAIRHLEKGRVVVFGGGTGNPYCTTDTAAAQYALEIGADILIKATQVDGIYDSDPRKNPNARRYDHITFQEALGQRLEIMDATAFSLCMNYHMNILVLDFWQEGALEAAIQGQRIGTLVTA